MCGIWDRLEAFVRVCPFSLCWKALGQPMGVAEEVVRPLRLALRAFFQRGGATWYRVRAREVRSRATPLNPNHPKRQRMMIQHS